MTFPYLKVNGMENGKSRLKGRNIADNDIGRLSGKREGRGRGKGKEEKDKIERRALDDAEGGVYVLWGEEERRMLFRLLYLQIPSHCNLSHKGTAFAERAVKNACMPATLINMTIITLQVW